MTWIEKHDENLHGRDFFVGDLHGQYHLLEQAMHEVAFDRSRDRLFSVGDLIDRGAESLRCLSLAFEPWFHGVRGNHEVLAHDALAQGTRGAWELWQVNGGSWIARHDVHEVRVSLEKALRRLPYAREVMVAGKHIGMVHAEPPRDWRLLEIAGCAIEQALVWGRTRIHSGDCTPVANIDAVVVGHTILETPTTLGNVHYIDTGAFHTGRLTMLDARDVLAS